MKFRYLFPIAFIVMFFTSMIEVYPQISNPLAPTVETSVIYLGPVIGYNKSMHSVDLASFAMYPNCPYFTNGDDNGFFVGMSYEYPIGGLVNSRHSIIVRALYNTMPASFSVENNDEYPSLVDIPGGYEIVKTSTTNKLKVDYSMITAEVMYKFNVLDNFGLAVTVGPTFDFALTKTFTQRLILNGPPEVQFRELSEAEQQKMNIHIIRYEDNKRTIVVNDGDIPSSNSFRMGIKAGIQYTQEMPGGFYLVPAIYYNFGVTKLSSAEDWRVDAFQVGVDIRFAL